MSKRNFLLEIGLEEMPARFVTDAMQQLKQKMKEWLNENRLTHDSIDAFSTPRRLAIRVNGLADKQEDLVEEARGPAKNIAVDDDGNWTKAALGFSKGQGVSQDDLYFKEVKGTDYVFANKEIKGKYTSELLTHIDRVITSLSFPKNMRWGEYQLRFVRPIHWLVALFGEEIIPFTITNVQSDRFTFGHRVLGDKVDITSTDRYEEDLLEQCVIVDSQTRKNAIRNQLTAMAEEQNWSILITEDLLEEVNNLVEYPTALYGKYDEDFLKLPEEVLITSMREHQRYFPVEDKKGKLLPYFVTIRNGNEEFLENVQKGNEKVLRARLSDAKFFYEEDQKLKPEEATKKLDYIVFQEELGTIGDKLRRVESLSLSFGNMLSLDKSVLEDTKRAASISKFDLVTLMVDEFTELQGLMGEKYALLAGEKPEVAKAIKEHYKPKHAGDNVPDSNIGAVIGLAEKMDTIVACFGIGMIPTGSQDPYGLRRQAAGVSHILLEHDFAIDLDELIQVTITEIEKTGVLHKTPAEVKQEVLTFFGLRLKNVLAERNIRYDIADAVLNNLGGQIRELVKKAEFLQATSNDAGFKDTVEALSRITNIARKAEEGNENVKEELLNEQAEKDLYRAYRTISTKLSENLEAGYVESAYRLLEDMKPSIHAYFDHVMVMTDDEALKQNRLRLMSCLSEEIKRFADFQQIVFSA
ncbi:glycine--tRNA ligase subunit beta [Salibacterium salarium]|uniref:Glycine--tRNA ligase beta subunit n=1 Tax=Salibacterium salarium TaxID=284579 RepID=A0A3R9P9R2_9BACI|nr:glycine--tRNA ligase subunit beta [Salibacterium salarium]RSL34488.1 glycine--tRNA ligase subunit beta [Salibacterium salarium]